MLLRTLAAVFAIVLLCWHESAASPMTWPCQGRCISAAMISDKGRAYFFRGDQFWRYDVQQRKVDQGEQPLRNWKGLPKSWRDGIDGVLNGGDGKAYWFKGGEYVRLDIESGKIDAGPLPIAPQWPGLPQTWAAGFDAAVYWSKRKVYFFKGREYLVYDLATDTAVEPQPIAGNLRGFPEAWAEGIDAAVNWANGKVYFFKGAEYIRYDIAANASDRNYPRPIATNWPGLMALVDWADWFSAKVSESGISVGREPDKRPIFLCAVKVGDALYPGKTWAESKSCVYTEGQREVSAEVYSVASTNLSIAWGSKGSAPTNRWIPVGVSSGGRRYYLCRAPFAGGLYPGRIESPGGGCTIGVEGKSHTLEGSDVEVAAAPTTANAPFIPDLARMLSPLAGSGEFAGVCGAEVVFTIEDTSAAAQYPSGLPELKTILPLISRNTCAMLYKKRSDVPRYARKLQAIIRNFKDRPYKSGGIPLAQVLRHDSHSELMLHSAFFRRSPTTIVTILYHELAHTTQQSDFGPNRGPLNEGVAEYIMDKAWGRRRTPPTGDWKSGYQQIAYFLAWLEERYPDFVYKLVMSASTGQRLGLEFFRKITGRPFEQLWDEYQASIPVTMAQPESLLRQ